MKINLTSVMVKAATGNMPDDVVRQEPLERAAGMSDVP
jgi:hypothetical protein